jgi:hypothetical protein
MHITISTGSYDAAIFGDDQGVFVLGDEGARDVGKYRVGPDYL